MDDLPVATRFFVEFLHEAMPNDAHADAVERITSSIESGRLYLWVVEEAEDTGDKVVSMEGASRGLPTGRTIGPVYTPVEQRGKGYAYCTLFTDLNNPTSNHIYQQIGYKPVCDYAMYSFDPLAQAN